MFPRIVVRKKWVQLGQSCCCCWCSLDKFIALPLQLRSARLLSLLSPITFPRLRALLPFLSSFRASPLSLCCRQIIVVCAGMGTAPPRHQVRNSFPCSAEHKSPRLHENYRRRAQTTLAKPIQTAISTDTAFQSAFRPPVSAGIQEVYKYTYEYPQKSA